MRHEILIAFAVFGLLSVPAWSEGGADRNGDAPLAITADFIWRNSPTPPVDRRVYEYFDRVVVERTGVRATWQNSAYTEVPASELISQWVAAGTMPEVIQFAVMFQDNSWRIPWTAARPAIMWDADKVKRYLPGYVRRLARYGVKVEDVLEANRYQGENWYIPIRFGFSQFPSLASMPEAKKAGQNYYAVGMRDDVLKMVYPGARTEDQLRGLFAKNGQLATGEIVGDIPIHDLEDLYRYLVKVKALNLRVGSRPLIPAGLSAQSEEIGSVDWSLRTIIGYHWMWPVIFTSPPDFGGSFFLQASPAWEQYLRWWNRLYNEGLLDPEIFVMKNDQYFQKAIDGQYAVLNFWGPINEARRTGQERGYGYRYFPLFYGGLADVFSNRTGFLSLQASPLAITKKAEKNLDRVAKWVDWYLSEEHDELAFWGSPDMYTGTGAARRYRSEYAGVEQWAVYGEQSSRDGKYFGLQHSYLLPTNEYETVKLPIGGISFFDLAFTYPEGPYFVYPKDPGKIAASTDIWQVCADTIYRTVWDDYTLWTRARWPEVSALPSVIEWETRQGDRWPELYRLEAQLLTGPAAEFDARLAEYRRIWREVGTPEMERDVAAWMARYYREEILPKRFTMTK